MTAATLSPEAITFLQKHSQWLLTERADSDGRNASVWDTQWVVDLLATIADRDLTITAQAQEIAGLKTEVNALNNMLRNRHGMGQGEIDYEAALEIEIAELKGKQRTPGTYEMCEHDGCMYSPGAFDKCQWLNCPIKAAAQGEEQQG